MYLDKKKQTTYKSTLTACLTAYFLLQYLHTITKFNYIYLNMATYKEQLFTKKFKISEEHIPTQYMNEVNVVNTKLPQRRNIFFLYRKIKTTFKVTPIPSFL